MLLIYANCQADEMLAFLQRSDAMTALMGMERIFLGALHEFIAQHGEAEARARLARVTIVWEQASQASQEERAHVRALVPQAARWLRFPALTCSALWPFATSDNRPGGDPLFPYSDRLAAQVWRQLGGHEQRLDEVDDDVLFDCYMELSIAKMPDPERMLELDLLSWQQRDVDADIPMAGFLLDRLRRTQLFYTAGRATWVPTGEMLRGLVEATIADAEVRCAVLADMQQMAAAYVGNDTLSMPIHPLVAERLGLEWHDAGALCRWRSYTLGFRDFMLRCIRLSDLR